VEAGFLFAFRQAAGILGAARRDGGNRMVAGEKLLPDEFREELIAACGMNCALCYAFLREKNRCGGCNGEDDAKPRHCAVCRIKTCDERTGDLCFECAKHPCTRLRRLDRRYRAKYGMSMLENLDFIRELGLEAFLAFERVRWTCAGCGGAICVHSEHCIYCGHLRERAPSA
jgi:hypothetical protein